MDKELTKAKSVIPGQQTPESPLQTLQRHIEHMQGLLAQLGPEEQQAPGINKGKGKARATSKDAEDQPSALREFITADLLAAQNYEQRLLFDEMIDQTPDSSRTRPLDPGEQSDLIRFIEEQKERHRTYEPLIKAAKHRQPEPSSSALQDSPMEDLAGPSTHQGPSAEGSKTHGKKRPADSMDSSEPPALSRNEWVDTMNKALFTPTNLEQIEAIIKPPKKYRHAWAEDGEQYSVVPVGRLIDATPNSLINNCVVLVEKPDPKIQQSQLLQRILLATPGQLTNTGIILDNISPALALPTPGGNTDYRSITTHNTEKYRKVQGPAKKKAKQGHP